MYMADVNLMKRTMRELSSCCKMKESKHVYQYNPLFWQNCPLLEEKTENNSMYRNYKYLE